VDVVEDEFPRIRGPNAELSRDLLGREPVAISLHHELREPRIAVLDVRIGLTEDHEKVPHRPVRDPHLVAVDDPFVAVLLGPGVDRRDVRARPRLGDRRPHDGVPLGDRRQVLLLLLLGSVFKQRIGPERGRGDAKGDARVHREQFLDDECHLQRRVVSPPVLQREMRAEEAHLDGLVHDRIGILLLAVVLGGHRRDFVLPEPPDLLADRLLLVREPEVHTAPLGGAR